MGQIMDAPVPVLMILYGRLAYSQLALESVVKAPGHPLSVTIWNNGVDRETAAWLRYLDRTRFGVAEIIQRPENSGIAPAMNYFFRRYHDAKYVCKVDNDSILSDGWLANLVDVLENPPYDNIGAVSGCCLRPNGHTFAAWVREHMKTVPFRDGNLHFNNYVLGSGVLINMSMIRARGLLSEAMPCKLAGWTDFVRVATEIERSWRVCFYDKIFVRLLNLEAEHQLSGDYPEYDLEISLSRNGGNSWWTHLGGLPGVAEFIKEHGGHAPLTPATEPPPPLESPKPRRYLTACDDHAQRSTLEWWEARVSACGETGSTFPNQDPARTAAFTQIHENILADALPGKDTLECGAGWGRLSFFISRLAKSYVGTEFVQRLVDKAKENLPHLDFRCADARRLPFVDESFDVVVAVACVSSFDEVFPEVLAEMKRVLRPGGRVIFLEEEWARSDWKLNHG